MAGSWVTRWRVRAGYPLAVLYFVLATPTLRATGVGAVISAIGLVIRGAAAGHLRKLESLTTTGPYALTRNPLYLGSAFLAAGFAVAGASIWSALVLAAYFFAFYPAVMKKEEAELRARYGPVFDEYAKRVPLFFPATRRHGNSSSMPNGGAQFSWEQYWRNREYQAAIGTLGALALVWLRMLARKRLGW